MLGPATAHNGGVDAAARIKSTIAQLEIGNEFTLPPLASNDLLGRVSNRAPNYFGSADSSSNFVVCSVTLCAPTIFAVSIRRALKTEAGMFCDGGNAEARVAVPN